MIENKSFRRLGKRYARWALEYVEFFESPKAASHYYKVELFLKLHSMNADGDAIGAAMDQFERSLPTKMSGVRYTAKYTERFPDPLQNEP